MSLFACESCNAVENTATCGLVWDRIPCPGPDPSGDPATHPEDCWRCRRDPGFVLRRKLICSECNPEIGAWHGLFPKVDADEAGYYRVNGSRYISKWRCPDCGEEDISKRYGGPADLSNDGTDPCDACVMRSFAEHG